MGVCTINGLFYFASPANRPRVSTARIHDIGRIAFAKVYVICRAAGGARFSLLRGRRMIVPLCKFIVQPGVLAAAFQKGVVVALFHDLPMI